MRERGQGKGCRLDAVGCSAWPGPLAPPAPSPPASPPFRGGSLRCQPAQPALSALSPEPLRAARTRPPRAPRGPEAAASLRPQLGAGAAPPWELGTGLPPLPTRALWVLGAPTLASLPSLRLGGQRNWMGVLPFVPALRSKVTLSQSLKLSPLHFPPLEYENHNTSCEGVWGKLSKRLPELSLVLD